MKARLTMVVLFVALQITAQSENQIQTTVLKAEHLISYAADNFPTDEPQQVYLLVEAGKAGIAVDDRFYIEQGLKLLLKRLGEEDKIAIGTYGVVNATVLPFTEIGDLVDIENAMHTLFKGTFKQEYKDGIAMAYNLAEKHYDDEMISTVIMLRGTGQQLITTNETAIVSVYQQISQNSGIKTVVKDETLNPTNREERKQQRAQRKQAKAAQHKNLGGAIALTALTILPEILDVIKD